VPADLPREDLMDEIARKLASSVADRYRIERELGAGGMARVYLAQDLRHGREVAIKVLRPELAEALGSERFVREIRLLASSIPTSSGWWIRARATACSST
jgi:serine/threonine protein kinase